MEWRPAARGGGRGGALAEGRGRRERRWGRGALAAGLGGGRRLALGSGEGTRETLESLVEMIYIQGYYCVRGHMSAGLRVFGFGY